MYYDIVYLIILVILNCEFEVRLYFLLIKRENKICGENIIKNFIKIFVI